MRHSRRIKGALLAWSAAASVALSVHVAAVASEPAAAIRPLEPSAASHAPIPVGTTSGSAASRSFHEAASAAGSAKDSVGSVIGSAAGSAKASVGSATDSADSSALGSTAADSAAVRASRPYNARQGLPARDGEKRPRRMVHGVRAGLRAEWIVQDNPFLAGRNAAGKPITTALSFHAGYTFRDARGSLRERIYKGPYQGVGVAHYRLGNSAELGDPTVVYLFQGARLARIAPRLTLDYEWNFGLSAGWKPYDARTNPKNVMTGSKANAFIGVDFFFRYRLTRRLRLDAGLSLTHFSNANTSLPNAGLNAVGGRFGIACDFGEPEQSAAASPACELPFPRHMSYDLMLFGAWCQKFVMLNGRQLLPRDAYPVLGFNFGAYYNFGWKFRAGLSLDGVYDGSANIYTEDYIISGGYDPGHTFHRPPIDRQLALGVSARTEFVMPVFTVGIGLGVNVLHGGGDLRGFYQMLTLKVAATRSAFVHIGYCLRDFQKPHYLMLGLGYRFNNRYPRLR